MQQKSPATRGRAKVVARRFVERHSLNLIRFALRKKERRPKPCSVLRRLDNRGWTEGPVRFTRKFTTKSPARGGAEFVGDITSGGGKSLCPVLPIPKAVMTVAPIIVIVSVIAVTIIAAMVAIIVIAAMVAIIVMGSVVVISRAPMHSAVNASNAARR